MTRSLSPFLPRAGVLLVVLAVALAGCTTPAPDEAGDGTDTDFSRVDTTSGDAAFTVESLNVTARALPGETDAAFFEDARLVVALTVANAGENASREFVTLLVDGDVVLTERVALAPGASASFEHVHDADGPGTVTMEARVGSERVQESVELESRAHAGDTLETPVLHARLNHATVNASADAMTVNVTLAHVVDADAANRVESVATRLLCENEAGEAFTHGWAALATPAPGNASSPNGTLPLCPASSAPLAVQMLVWDRSGAEDPLALTWLLAPA